MAAPIQYLSQWIGDNATKIQYAPTCTGGWERWAQFDFSLELTHHGIENILEDPCFKNSDKRADITIVGMAVIELKVFNQLSETINDYVGKINADITKFKKFPLEDNYARLTRWAIGIASLKGIVEQGGGRYPQDVDRILQIFEQKYPDLVHTVINLTAVNLKFVISYKQVV